MDMDDNIITRAMARANKLRHNRVYWKPAVKKGSGLNSVQPCNLFISPEGYRKLQEAERGVVDSAFRIRNGTNYPGTVIEFFYNTKEGDRLLEIYGNIITDILNEEGSNKTAYYWDWHRGVFENDLKFNLDEISPTFLSKEIGEKTFDTFWILSPDISVDFPDGLGHTYTGICPNDPNEVYELEEGIKLFDYKKVDGVPLSQNATLVSFFSL